MRHGAKVKLCRHEGCTNHVVRRGVCIRHGANRDPLDESTVLFSASRYENDETTAPLPNIAVPHANHRGQSDHPPSIILCPAVDCFEA